MRPLNYAILKYFTTVEKASAKDVVAALKSEYGNNRNLTEKRVLEALMTAEANALLAESGYELDNNGELVLYYSCDDAGTINNYIK